MHGDNPQSYKIFVMGHSSVLMRKHGWTVCNAETLGDAMSPGFMSGYIFFGYRNPIPFNTICHANRPSFPKAVIAPIQLSSLRDFGPEGHVSGSIDCDGGGVGVLR